MAQAPQAQTPQAPTTGLEPTWDIAVVIQQIGAQADLMLPALNHLSPRAWVTKGASETYVEQWESSWKQTQAISMEAASLARNPEKLSSALQLFFRMQGVEQMISSLQQGAAKYQSQEAAQNLAALFAEGGANRERLRMYIVNLASEREHQFEVMDKEAQRCRAGLTAAPPPQPCKVPSTRKK